jgi:hypothetical protein
MAHRSDLTPETAVRGVLKVFGDALNRATGGGLSETTQSFRYRFVAVG